MPITLNGTTGITTPGLTNTGTETISSGTANGVTYLNASKVLTSGSGLVFDGTRFFVGTTTTTTSSTQSGEIYSTGAVGFMLTNTTAANFPVSIKNEGSSGTRNLIRFYEGPAGGTSRASVSLDGSNYLTFDTNNFIINTGNVGIGTSSPGKKLDVNGEARITTGLTVTAATSSLYTTDGTLSNYGTSNGVYLNGHASGWLALQASGSQATQITLYGQSEASLPNTIVFKTNSAERMRLDSSGNLGLGVTPSAWATLKAMEFAGVGNSVSGNGASALFLSNNSYFNSSWKYANTAAASQINLSSGAIAFNIAASGTAGNAITFTQALTLDASGNLLVGTTVSRDKVFAYGNGVFIGVGSSSTTGYRGFNIRNADSDSTAYGVLQMEMSAGEMQLKAGTSGWGGFLTIHTNGSERARITSGGALCVGTSTPGASTLATFSSTDSVKIRCQGGTNQNGIVLDAVGSASQYYIGSGNSLLTSDKGFIILDVTNNRGVVYDNQTSGELRTSATTYSTFFTNGSERARITSGGELLVGTTTAGYGLFTTQRVTINPNQDGMVVAPLSQNFSAYTVQGNNDTGTRYAMYIANGSSTAVGNISFTSSATAYNTSSDRRLKENVAQSDDAGSLIDAIEVVKHDWKVGGHVRYGVIAQDLHDVVPEAVTVGDSEDVEALKNPWGVDYSKLVPMLVKEIQSLRARLAAAGI